MVGVDKAIIARYKMGKENFEILVDADLAYDYQHGDYKIPIESILAERKIYLDAQAGLLAPEVKMDALFKTKDVLEIAKQIIMKGYIHMTTEHLHKKREEQRKKILQIIHTNTCDPKTNLPHPMVRLETAMNEVKYNIDPFKPAEMQAQDVIHLLKPILPIKVGANEFEIKIPHHYVNASKPTIKKSAQIIRDRFDSEGNWYLTVSLPSGLIEDFFNALNNHTHGEILSKKL